nr:MAG TPA: hypothetical protein [Caudoviricetes sp.]
MFLCQEGVHSPSFFIWLILRFKGGQIVQR